MDKLYTYEGSLLELTDTSLTMLNIPADSKTVGDKLKKAIADPNCKIIAHRGYHVTAAQNTIQAFKDAAEAGFSWIEIDIRKTADGIYVMSHDNAVTMYNNGSPVSVTIANANYSTIKNYTWDSAGKYKLCTLQAVFNAMKPYDMRMILDLKTGSNAEVMEIAATSGAVDRVMLTYKSGDSLDLYKKYDSVPIRVYASYYDAMLNLQENTVNPLYTDMNVQGVNNDHIPKALAAGVPFIFSGCTLNNKPIWQVLASGVMANTDLNISYDEFSEALNVDYDVIATITPSVQSVDIDVGSTGSVTAQSSVATPGGYIYGYTRNPKIATVIQNAWGSDVSFTLTGVSSGSTILRLFTGSGEIVDIPVTVS